MLQGYGASLLHGAALTLAVALASLVLALVLGLAGAAAKLSDSVFWRRAATAYTTVIRGVPDLVLMMLIFYGGQIALNARAERDRSGQWSTSTRSCPASRRSASSSVPTSPRPPAARFRRCRRGRSRPGARSACRPGSCSGASPRRRCCAWRSPSFTNNWLVLVKATALVSLIGLNDMLQKAQQAAGATREPFTFYLAVGALYLALTTVSGARAARARGACLARREGRGAVMNFAAIAESLPTYFRGAADDAATARPCRSCSACSPRCRWA